jgi:deoxyribonuclease-4
VNRAAGALCCPEDKSAMLLGAHESVAGGAFHAIARGREDGCEAIQIFARPSAQWRAKPLLPDEVSMFRSEHAAVGWPVLSHASYLINLCASDSVILERSRAALAEELFRAEELGLDYVVLHPGSHLGCGEDEGTRAVAESLTAVLARARGLRVKLLLEITAGQGSCLGCRFEHMDAVLEKTRGGHEVGICFDTCHAHAAGEDLTDAVERARAITGRIDLMHVNDSRDPAGTGADRHANIGKGTIDPELIRHMVATAAAPSVVETPREVEDLRADIEFVRSALAG